MLHCTLNLYLHAMGTRYHMSSDAEIKQIEDVQKSEQCD